jgi:hypothetical protein
MPQRAISPGNHDDNQGIAVFHAPILKDLLQSIRAWTTANPNKKRLSLSMSREERDGSERGIILYEYRNQ